MAIYQLGVLGFPDSTRLAAIKTSINRVVGEFGLDPTKDVLITDGKAFTPDPKFASAALYFGSAGVQHPKLDALLDAGIPLIPVVSDGASFSKETPEAIRHINGIYLSDDDAELTRTASVLLECVGLLPRQRRVFLSYCRTESREVALQLFEAFSARQFDVFLDTHGVPPAEDFQATLWHRLCDSDVVVMLDTPSYFTRRWTKVEFGRAIAKSITILRLEWPGIRPSPLVSGQPFITLTAADFGANSRLQEPAVNQICEALEIHRSQSIAIRNSEIVGALKVAVHKLRGRWDGVGQRRCCYIRLHDGTSIVAYPALGVPTSETIQEAAASGPLGHTAVIYDHVGLHKKWQAHLCWLEGYIRDVALIKASEAAWEFGGWEAR